MLLRVGFASINFLFVAMLFLGAYSFSAELQYEAAITSAQSEEGDIHGTRVMDISNETEIPRFTIAEAIPLEDGTYLLHVELQNWEFTPEHTGDETTMNEGHAHVYINGKKEGRMYGNWFHIEELPPGKHNISITLNGNDHTIFLVDGEMVGTEITVMVK